MADSFSWTCPFCDRDTTITSEDRLWEEVDFDIKNSDGERILAADFIVCPNTKCKKFSLTLTLFTRTITSQGPRRGTYLRTWNLIPESMAKSFPNYIPKAILDDYNEACLICNLSPKASATLSRRCLQGILRDFWNVKPGNLTHEIEEIKDKVDPLTWEAIDSVRKVGNIGAHMEKDINLIVDVEPEEAGLLIDLIETLLRDWYISREERKVRLQGIKQIADQKDQLKTAESSSPLHPKTEKPG